MEKIIKDDLALGLGLVSKSNFWVALYQQRVKGNFRYFEDQ